MSSKRRFDLSERPADINISPMIDMVFILLIFFIVTTVFVDERGMPIDRPQPGLDGGEGNDDPVIFRLERSGRIFHKQEDVNLARAEEIIKNTLATSDVPVILQIQRGTASARMIQMMDTARRVDREVKVTVSTVD